MTTISVGVKQGQGKGLARRGWGMRVMEIVVESNDPVRLSFLVVLLRDAGLHPMLFDTNMASMLGTAMAVQQRLAVPSDEAVAARRVLNEAGEL